MLVAYTYQLKTQSYYISELSECFAHHFEINNSMQWHMCSLEYPDDMKWVLKSFFNLLIPYNEELGGGSNVSQSPR